MICYFYIFVLCETFKRIYLLKCDQKEMHVYLWWYKGGERECLRRVRPAGDRGVEGFPVTLLVLIILCKVAGVTVVGLIGDFIV